MIRSNTGSSHQIALNARYSEIIHYTNSKKMNDRTDMQTIIVCIGYLEMFALIRTFL